MKITAATGLSLLCAIQPFSVFAIPLNAHDAFNKGSLAQWSALSDDDKLDSIRALADTGRSEVAKAHEDGLKTCVETKVTEPQYAGYDLATAYTACLFKLGLN